TTGGWLRRAGPETSARAHRRSFGTSIGIRGHHTQLEVPTRPESRARGELRMVSPDPRIPGGSAGGAAAEAEHGADAGEEIRLLLRRRGARLGPDRVEVPAASRDHARQL